MSLNNTNDRSCLCSLRGVSAPARALGVVNDTKPESQSQSMYQAVGRRVSIGTREVYALVLPAGLQLAMAKLWAVLACSVIVYDAAFVCT